MGHIRCILIGLCFFLILLAGLMNIPARASDHAEEIPTDSDMLNASVPSPVSVATELNELRELIYLQSRQIEQLKSELEQQKRELGKAVEAMAASSGTARPSAAATSSVRRSRLRLNRRSSLKWMILSL